MKTVLSVASLIPRAILSGVVSILMLTLVTVTIPMDLILRTRCTGKVFASVYGSR